MGEFRRGTDGRRMFTNEWKHRQQDAEVLERIRSVVRERASYGHRRVTALLRKQGVRYNRKRVRRVMRLHGLQLAPVMRRTGRAHTGRIAREASNERWCSDAFEIGCDNGEAVQIAFALDCCDREAIAWVAAPRDLDGSDIRLLMSRAVEARFGAGEAPGVQWLSDNGGMYRALETQAHAERLGLDCVTTPARSPQSNGMSEAFVGTMRRDYVDGADVRSASVVLARIASWIDDYNRNAPHSALKMQSPAEFRAQQVRGAQTSTP